MQKKQKPVMPTIAPWTNTADLPSACRRKCVVFILKIVEYLTPWVGTVHPLRPRQRGTCRVHNTDESFMVFVDFLTYYVWTLPTCPLLAVMQGSISKIRWIVTIFIALSLLSGGVSRRRSDLWCKRIQYITQASSRNTPSLPIFLFSLFSHSAGLNSCAF